MKRGHGLKGRVYRPLIKLLKQAMLAAKKDEPFDETVDVTDSKLGMMLFYCQLRYKDGIPSYVSFGEKLPPGVSLVRQQPFAQLISVVWRRSLRDKLLRR